MSRRKRTTTVVDSLSDAEDDGVISLDTDDLASLANNVQNVSLVPLLPGTEQERPNMQRKFGLWLIEVHNLTQISLERLVYLAVQTITWLASDYISAQKSLKQSVLLHKVSAMTSPSVKRKADSKAQRIRCYAAYHDGRRCENFAVESSKLCRRHSFREAKEWPEENNNDNKDAAPSDEEKKSEAPVVVKKKRVSKPSATSDATLPTSTDSVDKASTTCTSVTKNVATTSKKKVKEFALRPGDVFLKPDKHLNLIFWPGTSYIVKSLDEPYVIGVVNSVMKPGVSKLKGVFADNVIVEPLLQDDINTLKTNNIPYKIISFDRLRSTFSTPSTEISKFKEFFNNLVAAKEEVKEIVETYKESPRFNNPHIDDTLDY